MSVEPPPTEEEQQELHGHMSFLDHLEELRKRILHSLIAVAVAFALAVTYPSAGNLGGGGFLLYRDKTGQAAFFDFRERAPMKASRDMYLDSSGKPTRDSVAGWRSSGVPAFDLLCGMTAPCSAGDAVLEDVNM